MALNAPPGALLACIAALLLASAVCACAEQRSSVNARESAARNVPANPQLPPVPGYIPVYIQSGDSPPDVQRLYESHRTLALAASNHAPAHAPTPPRRSGQQEAVHALADGAPGPAPGSTSSGSRPRPLPEAPSRSRVPAVHKEANAGSTAGSAPSPAPASTNSRITKKGGAGPAPTVPSAPAAPVHEKPLHAKNNIPKKRTGTRVQYQQQQKAAQTRRRQQQQRSAKLQQQQQQEPQQQRQYHR